MDRLSRKAPGRVLLHACTLLAVALGFVMFRSSTAAGALAMIGRMFSFASGDSVSALTIHRILTPTRIAALACGTLFSLPIAPRLRAGLAAHSSGELLSDAVCLAGLAACVLSMAGGGFTPFIYQQF